MDSSNPRTVLVIDDDVHLRNIMDRMLKLKGHTVLLAESGEQGLEICERLSGIDYVILDLSLPGISGEETFSILHSKWPDLKIIISSGHGRSPVTERFLSMGAHDLLPKPFAMAELLAVIV